MARVGNYIGNQSPKMVEVKRPVYKQANNYQLQITETAFTQVPTCDFKQTEF